jgi:hypothetical protein
MKSSVDEGDFISPLVDTDPRAEKSRWAGADFSAD